MQIKNECGDLLFKHLVGSTLIDNASPTSDVDWFNVHKSILIWDPLFITRNNSYSFVCYADFVNDSISIDITELIKTFTQATEIQSISYYSKILSHLYAIKYELISDIRDAEAFEFYLDWLKSPGIANIFWINIQTMFWKYLEAIPDNECNWSQDFDDSVKHAECKTSWGKLQVLSWPVVNKNLGYDNIHARRAFQDLFILKSILLSNSSITDDQRNFLNRVKNGEVPFDEYKKAKKIIWQDARLALESCHNLYFLGHGYSLEYSLQKKVFGIKGILNLIDKCSAVPLKLD